MSIKSTIPGRPWAKTRLRILDRDGWRCAFCGKPATTVDHIRPRSKGGDDSDWNLRAMCVHHNTSRRDRRVIVRATPLRRESS